MSCPFIAYVSVRGGTGRTTAAVAAAHALRYHSFTALVIDLDLEAPGLTHELSKMCGPQRGFADLAVSAMHDQGKGCLAQQAFNHCVRPFGFGIMPAANLEGGEGSAIWTLGDWLYERGGENWFLRLKLDILASGLFDCVLLDMRAGNAKITNRVLTDIADVLVVLSHPRESHIQDTKRFVERAGFLRGISRMQDPEMLTALTMVPQGEPRDGVSIRYVPRLSMVSALTKDLAERELIADTYKPLSDPVVKLVKKKKGFNAG